MQNEAKNTNKRSLLEVNDSKLVFFYKGMRQALFVETHLYKFCVL